MNTPDSGAQTAPDFYYRSYEDKDELYWEDYCRGLGDPDSFGYPGEPQEGSDERINRSSIDPKPF